MSEAQDEDGVRSAECGVRSDLRGGWRTIGSGRVEELRAWIFCYQNSALKLQRRAPGPSGRTQGSSAILPPWCGSWRLLAALGAFSAVLGSLGELGLLGAQWMKRWEKATAKGQ